MIMAHAAHERRPSPGGLHPLVWGPLLIGGIAVAFAVVHVSGMRRWWNRWLGSASPIDVQSLSRLRHLIIGTDKHAVARTFGPPPTTGDYRMIAAGGHLPDYFRADTWYYPVDRTHK